MKDFAKSIRTMNSNKEEIIKKKKEAGATLKVDNGQKLEFSDGTTYVKTSFSDDYREAHNYTGNSKVGNSSVESQEWSMFKGLSKDAEKEVGNSIEVGSHITIQQNGKEYDVKVLKDMPSKVLVKGPNGAVIEVSKTDIVNVGNQKNKKVKNSSVREYKDSQGRIAQIDFNSDGTDADMAIYEDERMLNSVEQRNFSTIRDAEQYVQSHGFRRVG